MMVKINPQFRFFTLDTGRLPEATYEAIDRVGRHYNIKFEILFPDTAQVEQMVREKGINLFYESPENRNYAVRFARFDQPTNFYPHLMLGSQV